ncbi:uncharacterized protein LOC109809410 [Cajanus cajan]|uniref:Acyl-coenzyme A thioesterase 13 n=1 Tax=Cajanus cajan TaxID=3821 RepID=A0A151SSQ3_CAJCA|nr:uncharacterized protein LOC109809410 [Cajanus cajan]KYP57798.1 Acyl-coenzyme A thioesterase 13 [Cajanus cajan]
MELEAVKRYLEKGGVTASLIDDLPPRFLEPLVMNSLQVDLIEPGRIVCSMKIPQRLLNAGNSLHGGATAALVDVVGSAAIPTVGYSAPNTGVSVEINVSYLDAAYADVFHFLTPFFFFPSSVFVICDANDLFFWLYRMICLLDG